MNNKYIENKQNRKRNVCHWKLAIGQIRQYPLLLIFILPIVIFTVFIWSNINSVIMTFNVPKIILPVYTNIVKFLGVLIPILLLWGLIDIIGTLTAREDEGTIQMAFKEGELRNGSPILMYKRKDKKTGITVREWYSHLPMKLWIEHQDEIADALSLHFVQPFSYGGKSNGNRIVMYSAEGREFATKNKPVYDEALEKDLEMLE